MKQVIRFRTGNPIKMQYYLFRLWAAQETVSDAGTNFAPEEFEKLSEN